MAMHLPLSKSVGESINKVEQTHRSLMASNAATNVLALACVSSVPVLCSSPLFQRSLIAEGNVTSMPGQALGLCIGA